MLWNAALIAGLGSIAAGFNDGLEWLEIPWQIDILFVVGGALIGLPLVFTLQNRKVEHLYVSIWYMGAALFWFPVLFLVGNLPGVHFGVEGATMNWWFGHRSEEHTSELQSLMRISYAVFCLKTKKHKKNKRMIILLKF